jgi:hypothetical protein
MIVDYKSKKRWNLISNKIMRLFDSASLEEEISASDSAAS